jgi:hypothetical protein
MRWLPISLIVVFVVLLGAMVWKYSQSTQPLPPPPIAVAQPQIPEPAPRNAARPPRSPAPPSFSSPAARAASRARVDKTVKIGRQRLQAQFTNERADPAWAMKREQGLVAHSTSEQITDLKLDPRNFQADCRSSTCRVTADFPDRSSAQDWFALFLTNTGTNLSKASYQLTANPDGTAHVEIYGLAR